MGSFKVFVGNLGAVASRAANDQSVITITTHKSSSIYIYIVLLVFDPLYERGGEAAGVVP